MKSPRPGKRWTASSEVLWIGIYPAEVNQDPRAESETRQCRVSTEGGTQFMMALMSAGGGPEVSQAARARSSAARVSGGAENRSTNLVAFSSWV